MIEKRKSGLVMILASGLIAALLACGIFAYLWIDQSISLAYAQLSNISTGQARDLAFSLLAEEWASLSEDEALKRLEAEAARRPQEKILVKHEPLEHVIWFGSARFEFQGGRLAKIR